MGEVVAWAFELAEEKLAGVLPSRWAHVHVDRRARLVVPLFRRTTASYWLAQRCCTISGTPRLVDTTALPMIEEGRRFGSYRRGAGDRDRTGMASLEDRAAIKGLTSPNAICGYLATDDVSDRC
jgi:hypothetical protein